MTEAAERWLEEAGVDLPVFEAYLARCRQAQGEVTDSDIPALALTFICHEAGVPSLGHYVHWDREHSLIDVEPDQAAEMLAQVDEEERNQAWEFVRKMTGAVVRPPCLDCEGSGQVICPDCGGEGFVLCEECEGEGCEQCGDAGEVDCPGCDGTGMVACETCNGTGTIPAAVAPGDHNDRDPETVSVSERSQIPQR